MVNMDFDTYIKTVDGSIVYHSDNLKEINGFLLTDKEINVLKDYEIPYENCKSLKEIIYYVEDKIDEFDSPEDLLDISDSISERDYYVNTKK